MTAWFWVALAMLPFALVGAWFLAFLFRNRKLIRGLLKSDA